MAGAVAAGFGVGLLCLPYLRMHSEVSALFQLRAAFIVPVAILLFQAALAWTPLAGGRGVFVLPESGRPYWHWPAILAGLAVIAGLWLYWLDPLAVVVLARVAGVWIQWPDLPAAAWLILFPVAAGGALLQGWIYRTAGFTGLVAAGILLECRHLPRLLS